MSWCAKSHTAADGLSYTWVTFVVSSQKASGMKITQCSSAHVKSVGCFIFSFAPHAFSSPFPLLFQSLFLLPLPKCLVEWSRGKDQLFSAGCFREAHADRQTHACACTHIRLRNKELLELLPRVFGLPGGPKVHLSQKEPRI